MDMVKTLDTLVKFFWVSPVQQAVALGMLTPATIICTHSAIKDYSQGNIGAGITNTLGALANIGFFLFNEYLAVGKMKEYCKIKNILEENSWDEGLIERKSHSWCQRNIVQIASNNVGFGNETKEYLCEKGYRWYHFVPEFYVSKPEI